MPEVTCNFKAEKDLWEQFKAIARRNDSDASKEIRKFMKSYIKRNASKEK